MDKTEIISNDKSTSEIIIKNGLADKISDYFEDKKYFLVTNTTLAKLYPSFLKNFKNNQIIIIKDGEKYKNEKTFNYIINHLLKEKIERKDCVVALGGGVVGDLAGYCASSVLRGVELIQIPTTLLAMCDSSIGGKTGYNTKYGKNLAGSFYLAKKVLIDPLFLKTLNNYEYKCALGEIVKYSLIEKSCKWDEFYNLFEILQQNSLFELRENIEKIIKICAKLKVSVVNKDKLEGGLRKILNLGHTFAHPIETLSNYKKISHGEAVSFGIKCASKLSYNLGKIDEQYYSKICNLLDKFNLINDKINFKKEKIIELMKHDKKTLDGKINIIMPSSPLEAELFENIDLPSLEACLP